MIKIGDRVCIFQSDDEILLKIGRVGEVGEVVGDRPFWSGDHSWPNFQIRFDSDQEVVSFHTRYVETIN